MWFGMKFLGGWVSVLSCRKTSLLSLIGCVGRLRTKKLGKVLCWFGTLLFGLYGMREIIKILRI
jgi:hypothetical protein